MNGKPPVMIGPTLVQDIHHLCMKNGFGNLCAFGTDGERVLTDALKYLHKNSDLLPTLLASFMLLKMS